MEKLLSASAGAGGILFAAAFILCFLLVVSVRLIDLKTRARIKAPTVPAENKEKKTESESGDKKTYYIVAKSKARPAGKRKKQAA